MKSINILKNILLFTILFFFGIYSTEGKENKLFQNVKQKDSSLINGSRFIYDDPEKAIEIGLDVFNSKNASNKQKAKSLILVATAYSSKRDYQHALFYLTKANKIAKNIDDPVIKINIITKLGELYHQLKVYDKAIRFLDKAEKMSVPYQNADGIQYTLADNYIIKGFIYKNQLNCEIAISYFNKGINKYIIVNGQEKIGNISIAEYNKGNCYILLLNYSEAIKSFRKSIEVAKEANANSLEAFALKGLAEVYTLQGKYKESIKLLTKALNISRKVGDLVLDQAIYKGLSDNYLGLNKWALYKKYNKLYLNIQFQVKMSERESISSSISDLYIDAQKKIDLEKSKLNFFLLITSLFSLIVLLFLFLTIKKNKKQTKFYKKTIEKLQK
ncbi:tetratricopeptide repeat protein [Mesonia aquimarina]|uniref:tetratricopeptide repeat protein n=1 Tax=Mesonia aquimarina TaxID=1504967 RepID=UPI000EF5EEDD|nr:tetratricopeptide repeat protein [Mesonia aquimarina]